MKDDTRGALNCSAILGSAVPAQLKRARAFLESHSTEELLASVGQTLGELSIGADAVDKRFFPRSYGGGQNCDDDVLAAQGMFYVTQSGQVMIDCIGGHYQMSWGYNHPALMAALLEASELGIVWDNHANTPSLPVKVLAEKLVSAAGGETTGLNRVLLGLCTGSVACEAALKIMWLRYCRDAERSRLGVPVVVVLAGNYHGTSMVPQALRGMWEGLISGMEIVTVEPHDFDALETVFTRYGRRIAGFWAEPVMMNREAILVDPKFLQLAQRLCKEYQAVLAIDEIQTGFWYPEVFLFRECDLQPDIVVIGKGLTAGFHPLAGLIYREDLDILEQYDAISTNGNASLAAYLALCNLALLEQERSRVAERIKRHEGHLQALASEFPDLIESVQGKGFLTGLKFQHRKDAIGFHQTAVARGLWLRVHAYHEGHRTVLLKVPLVADERIIDYLQEVMRTLLTQTAWR